MPPRASAWSTSRRSWWTSPRASAWSTSAGPSPAELVDVAEGLGRVDQVKLVTMAAAIAEGLGLVDQPAELVDVAEGLGLVDQALGRRRRSWWTSPRASAGSTRSSW